MTSLNVPAKAALAAGCAALVARFISRRRPRVTLDVSDLHRVDESPATREAVDKVEAEKDGVVVITMQNKSSNCLEDADDLNEPVQLTGGHAVPPSLAELWHEQVLCDLSATVSGVTFSAHRVVLAAGSTTLRKLYSTKPSGAGVDVGSSHLRIKNLDAEAFRAVLTFLYMGVCELPSARLLVPVLEAAAKLQITSLQESAATAISHRLLPANCLGAWALAEEYQLHSLEAAARAEALRAFEVLLSGGALAGLPFAQLCTLLDDDSLRTEAEERVFEAVVSWHGAQHPPPPPEVVVDLLTRVRFPLMRPEYVRGRVMGAPLMQSLQAKDVLAQALLAEMAGQAARHTRRRLCAASIYVAGGMGGPRSGTHAVERFCDGNWQEAPAMGGIRVYACSGVLAGKLYVVGGTGEDEGTVASVDVFDTATARWSEGPSLSTPRNLAACFVLQGKLFVCGGKDSEGNALSSVETFDPSVGWYPGPPLPDSRFGACASALGGTGFLCGGMHDSVGLSSVLTYDPGTCTWADGVPMPCARFSACAGALNGRLYVVGGCEHSSHGASASVQVFDPLSTEWTEAPLMCTTRMSAASTIMEGKLHIIGGVSGETTLTTVEVFDPASGSWVDGPPLPSPRAAACAAVLQL